MVRVISILILSCIVAFCQSFTIQDIAFLGNAIPAPSAGPSWTNVTSGLLAWWKFDENSGSTANDSAGTYTCGFAGNFHWISGVMGSAISTEGGSGYGTVSTTPTLQRPLSVSFWRWGYWATNNYIQTQPTQSGRMEIADAGIYSQFVVTPSVDQMFFTPPAGDNNWHLVVWTVESDGTGHAYLDAAPQVLSVDTGSHSPTNSSGFYIANGFSGAATVDDMRIYNRALNATEVTNLFNWRP